MHYSIVAASAGGLTDFKELPIVPAKFWLTALVFLSLSFLSACTGGEGGNQSNRTATAEAVSAEVVATATSIPVPTATTALPTTTVTPVDGLAAPTSASMVEPLPYAIDMPAGFTIHYYAKNVPNARSMALSPAGTLFVTHLPSWLSESTREAEECE